MSNIFPIYIYLLFKIYMQDSSKEIFFGLDELKLSKGILILIF